MAGVLERMRRSRKQPVKSYVPLDLNPSKVMELETAKEILAEVFRVSLSDVDEMIQNRFGKVSSQEACCEKDGLWPQEFWLKG